MEAVRWVVQKAGLLEIQAPSTRLVTEKDSVACCSGKAQPAAFADGEEAHRWVGGLQRRMRCCAQSLLL